jgi:NAD-dependent SIR2 family protein deacetylase
LLQINSQDDALNNQRESIEKLIGLLTKKRMILFAGAGTSAQLGYPSWEGLLNEIEKKFVSPPTIFDSESKKDKPRFADTLLVHISNSGRMDECLKFLERSFNPDNKQRPNEFHETLINLGFSGIFTTNYDFVLENALTAVIIKESGPIPNITSIDLCDEGTITKKDLSEYLRSLSSRELQKRILHVHGIYRNPEKIILSENKYLKAYGEITNDCKKIDAPLDSLHRKVLWSILVMYPVLFVGFSLSDPFFMPMLEIVRRDLKLDGDSHHYAILPSTDIEKAFEIKQKFCIESIFYYYVKDSRDYSGLHHLIGAINHEMGRSGHAGDLLSLTEELMER